MYEQDRKEFLYDVFHRVCFGMSLSSIVISIIAIMVAINH